MRLTIRTKLFWANPAWLKTDTPSQKTSPKGKPLTTLNFLMQKLTISTSTINRWVACCRNAWCRNKDSVKITHKYLNHIHFKNILSLPNLINLSLKQLDYHHPKFGYCYWHDFVIILEIHPMVKEYHLLLKIFKIHR